MGMEGTECDMRNDKGPKKDLRGFASSRCSVSMKSRLGNLPFLVPLLLFLSSVLSFRCSLTLIFTIWKRAA